MKKTRVSSSRKISAIMIIIISVVALCILCNGVIETKADAKAITINFEPKVCSTLDINDDFDDSCVLVVMDKYSSGFNKSHTSIFSNLPFVKAIKDLTKLTGDITKKKYLNQKSFRQILEIDLEEHSKQKVLDAISKIQKLDGVLWAGVNNYYQPTATYETPVAMTGDRYKEQWALNGKYGINLINAWNYSTGSKNVKVGIIDSGIAEHDDLRDNVIEGWNFVDDNNDTSDQLGHGTKIAGIIGATGKTENGVIGINKNVQMIPLKVISTKYQYQEGVDVLFDGGAILKAINWAIQYNVDILNMSFGDINENPSLKSAMNNYNGLMVCGAGNEGTNNDVIKYYPSDYSQGQEFSDRVISVAAANSYGQPAEFFNGSTNYGAKTVSLFAPGKDIITTCSPYGITISDENNPSGYQKVEGTSFAAPHVTGVAALLFAKYYRYIDKLKGGHIAAQVKATILDNVTPTEDPTKEQKTVTRGRLNAYYTLMHCQHIPSIMEGYGYNDDWYYWEGRVDIESEEPKAFDYNHDGELIIKTPTDLNFTMTTTDAFNTVTEIEIDMTFVLRNSADEIINIGLDDYIAHKVVVGIVSNSKYGVCDFTVYKNDLVNKERYTLTWTCKSSRGNKSYTYTRTFSFTVDYPDDSRSELPTPSCIADNSLITLADGSQVAVEDLTGEENLLVWNMFTGTFDTAPIIFIDKEEQRKYEVINLHFSDGTIVKVIDEHGFWDFDLNKYIYLRDDAEKYIGHWFNKQIIDENGNFAYTKVQLTDVIIQTETTSAWSPVTYGHLCYYVNGMLSMPGGIIGLINIFGVDPQTLKIDKESYLADIEKYGLFTYEEFAQICFVPESIFEAVCGQYLKVAIGKGLISIEELQNLISRYSKFWE